MELPGIGRIVQAEAHGPCPATTVAAGPISTTAVQIREGVRIAGVQVAAQLEAAGVQPPGARSIHVHRAGHEIRVTAQEALPYREAQAIARADLGHLAAQDTARVDLDHREVQDTVQAVAVHGVQEVSGVQAEVAQEVQEVSGVQVEVVVLDLQEWAALPVGETRPKQTLKLKQ